MPQRNSKDTRPTPPAPPTFDPTREQPIPLADVPGLPWLLRRNRRNFSVSTIFRWARKGYRGHHLEQVRIGDTLHTSEAALKRFFQRCRQPASPEARPAAAGDQGDHGSAEDELNRAGI